MRQLIRVNPMMLMVLRRFGISLGFGNSNVKDVCDKYGIDTATFLAVANFSCARAYDIEGVNLATLMDYLKNSHRYFLEFALPAIRRKLLESLPVAGRGNELSMLMLKYYDEYVEEVRSHMDIEDQKVFPYVRSLLNGQPTGNGNISDFEAHHRPLAPKLQGLKEVFISHYRGVGDEDLLNSALFDIMTVTTDLTSHCAIEDAILVPAVEELEMRTHGNNTDNDAKVSDQLTTREIDIIKLIARGKSNKEIAEELSLSVHTVTTHRRNIASKLEIHSAAALAVYAIVHNLVDISEIKV